MSKKGMTREEAGAMAHALKREGLQHAEIGQRLYAAGYKSSRGGGMLKATGVGQLLTAIPASSRAVVAYRRVDEAPPPPKAGMAMLVLGRPEDLLAFARGLA